MRKGWGTFWLIVSATTLIICGYAVYDFYVNEPFKVSTISPLPPFEPRKVVKFRGKEIAEEDYTKVLVIDTGHNGVEICASEQCNTSDHHFDFDNDNFAEAAPTFGYDDAFLVISNGIDYPRGNQVVGNNLVFPGLDGHNRPNDSFEILRLMDRDKDGKITEKDGIYRLFLWKQGKSYRKFPLKLTHFLSSNIESISLDVSPLREFDDYGNIYGPYAEVRYKDGLRTIIQEIWILTDTTDTQVLELQPIPDDIKKLPQLRALGKTPDLHRSMQLDFSGQLKELVEKLNSPKLLDDYAAREALIEEIIFSWTKVNDVEPDSRRFSDGVNYIGDARKLAALEKLQGKNYRGTSSGLEFNATPHSQSAPYLLSAYDFLRQGVKNTLLSQTLLKPILNKTEIVYEAKTGLWKFSSDRFSASLQDNLPDDKFEALMLLEDLSGLKPHMTQSNPDLMKEIRKVSLPGGINMEHFGEMVIKGTPRNDVLEAKTEQDIFYGLSGNDRLQGTTADNFYIYGRYDSADTISEKGGFDTIVFIGNIKSSDLAYSFNGLDLIISVAGLPGQTITVKDYGLDKVNEVETLHFAGKQKISLDETVKQYLKEHPFERFKLWVYRLSATVRGLFSSGQSGTAHPEANPD